MTDGNTIRSVAKAMELLQLLSDAGEAMTLTAISERAGLPKSTVFGLLTTMRDYDVITQHADGKYALGLRLFEYGCRASAFWNISSLARPYLEHLAEATGASAMLSTYENGHIVALDQAEGRDSLRIVSAPGARLLCTALRLLRLPCWLWLFWAGRALRRGGWGAAGRALWGAFWGATGRWAGAFWRGACWLCGWTGLPCPRRGWLPLARGAFSLRGALGAAGAAACGAGLRGCAGAFPSRAGCCACGALPLPAGRRRRRRCGAPFGVCAAFSIIHLNPVIRR